MILKKSSGETFIRARHDFERQPSVQNRFVFRFAVEKVLLFILNTTGLLEHAGPKRDVVINSLEKNVDFQSVFSSAYQKSVTATGRLWF